MKSSSPNAPPDDSASEASEPPLDPAARRLQAKIKRLLVISMVTLGIGLFAVAAAIIYRLTMPAGNTAISTRPQFASPTSMTLNFWIATEERLVAADFDEEEVRLVLEGPEGIRLVVLDPLLGTLRQERLLPRQ